MKNLLFLSFMMAIAACSKKDEYITPVSPVRIEVTSTAMETRVGIYEYGGSSKYIAGFTFTDNGQVFDFNKPAGIDTIVVSANGSTYDPGNPGKVTSIRMRIFVDGNMRLDETSVDVKPYINRKIAL